MEHSEVKLIMVTKETLHEQTVLRNLLKMYCHEWSQYNKLEVNADGNFAFEAHASDYWTKEGYHAFLIAVHESWAGFVLFDNEEFIVHKDFDYSLAEFLFCIRTGATALDVTLPIPSLIRFRVVGKSDAIRRIRAPSISGTKYSANIQAGHIT